MSSKHIDTLGTAIWSVEQQITRAICRKRMNLKPSFDDWCISNFDKELIRQLILQSTQTYALTNGQPKIYGRLRFEDEFLQLFPTAKKQQVDIKYSKAEKIANMLFGNESNKIYFAPINQDIFDAVVARMNFTPFWHFVFLMGTADNLDVNFYSDKLLLRDDFLLSQINVLSVLSIDCVSMTTSIATKQSSVEEVAAIKSIIHGNYLTSTGKIDNIFDASCFYQTHKD